LKKAIKIFSKILSTLLLLLLIGVVLVFYALQLPAVQTNLAQRATDSLSKKLGMELTVDKVSIKWLDELSLRGVLIKDTKGRNMIAIDEVFVNCETNFDMGLKSPFFKPEFPYFVLPQPYFKFNNNLDYILLRRPNVLLVQESDGDLNIDKFIAKIDSLTSGKPDPRIKGEHNKPFTIDEAVIENGIFTMHDAAEKRFPKDEFDQFNFTFNKFYGDIKNFMVLGDTIAFNMHDMRAIDYRSKLEIKQLNTKFMYSRQFMIFDKLLARLNNSVIKDYVSMNFNEPHDMSNFNEKVRLKANFKDCEIDAQDLAKFAPSLYKYKEIYKLKGKFGGTVHDFRVEDFDLKFGKNSSLEGMIAFKNLPDLKKAIMDFDLKPSQIDAPDTRQYVGDTLYKQQVEKFGLVSFSGTFKGLYDDFTTNASMKSSTFGSAFGNISMKIASNAAETTYSGDLTTENLDLGKITNEPELLQKLSMSGKIEGKGLTIKDALLNFNGHVKHVGFDGYDYKQVFMDGKMGHSLFDGRVSVKDTNIVFDLAGTVDFSKPLNQFNLKGKVERANLRPLGYSKNDVKLKSEINVNFQGNQMDNLLGEVKLLNTILSYDKKRLGVDSLFITSSLSDSLRKIEIISEFLNAQVMGKFLPSQVIKDVKRLTKEYDLFFFGKEEDRLSYYQLRPNFVVSNKYGVDYKVLFKKSQPLFAYFFPEMYISPGTELGGALNIRNTSELSLTGKIDTLRYENYAFYGCNIDVNSSKAANAPKVLTSIIFNSDNQQLSNMAATENLELTGAWGESNVIDFDGKIKQQKSTNKAQLFGKFTFQKEGFDIAFRNTKLDLLGGTWLLAKDNIINIHNNEICFQDVMLSNEKQRVSLSGTLSSDSSKTALIDIREFDLQTLKPLTNYDLKGIANGQLNLRDIYHNSLITSQLSISNLAYKNILIGNVAGEALWDQVQQRLNINSSVVRLNSEIFKLSGYYNPNKTVNSLNLKAELKKTNLEIFGTFVDDIFSNLGGYASGVLAITGTPREPILRGSTNFDKGVLRINALNTFLYFDDKMIFNEEGFLVGNDFKVRDAEKNGNTATLEGGIYYGGNGNFMMNLQAYMKGRDGFKIMNTTEKDNGTFFGVGITTGNVNLVGPFNNLSISANLASKKGTKMTIMMDNAESANADEKEIEFLPKVTKIETTKTPKDSIQNVDLSGIKMAFNFTITPDAECEVVFDRNLKDQLNAFGNGRLSIEYDTRGNFTMSGPYTVKNGVYNYSFQGISSLRKFNIQEGGTIRWSGDPKDADIDLKAVYTANVQLAGIPGIQPQTSSNSSSDLSNRYPVNISIALKEKILNPLIGFDIRFDPKQIPLQYQVPIQGFEQRLREDEQLMNKNLAILILANRFFSENNPSDALNAQFLVDNLGGILTNQIGSLVSKLDPNIDVGVQIGNVRQSIFDNMRVNAGLKLLNNRLKVGLNSTFLNTQSQDQIAANNQFYYGGEVEFALTEDGTWRIKAYSRSVPPSWISSVYNNNIIMNGVSLQFTRNFNSFFKKKPSTFLINQNTEKKPIGVSVSKQ
jgi:hypothetical protein